jgi:branched-chain amino acid transport system ATP-binding protein
MMLDVKNLDVFYGQSQVLRGVSLHIDPGEIVCLVGRNGVGKSTTMKAIVGLVQARGGAVSFKNQRVLGLPTHKIACMGIGYVPEDRRVFGGLSVLQNLRVAMRPSRSVRPWTLSDVFEIFPVLEQRRTQMAGSLSGGEQQMLTMARTLLGNPDLVLIDEPNEGLAPIYVQRMNAMIEEVHARGAAVLLVEQSLASVKALAHRAYVMSKGEIVFQGGTTELLSDPAVRRHYLEL